MTTTATENDAPPFHLIGEQRKVYALPLEETVLLKGSAGCGKTTCALARARQYLCDAPDLFCGSASVLFVTYTNSLKDYVGDMPRGDAFSGGIQIASLHSAVSRLARLKDRREVCDARKGLEVVAALAERPGGFAPRFLLEEFAWIKGMMLDAEAAYLEVERRGRGNQPRVVRDDRSGIWRAFAAYNEALRKQGLRDWDDYLRHALDAASDPAFSPDFTHVVVDEAQDFTRLALRLIARLVKGRSVTLVADAAQQIYRSGFSWRDVGFTVKSHCSLALTQNYRNTVEIHAAAAPLRARIAAFDAESAEATQPPRRNGPRPTLRIGADLPSVVAVLMQTVAAAPQCRIVVAEPTAERVGWMKLGLEQAGFSVRSLSKKRQMALWGMAASAEADGAGRPCVHVDTYHAMKGLEFDVVLLDGLGEATLPGDAARHGEESVNRNRKLLYMAMTRARESLHLFAPFEPSMILRELDASTYDRVCADAPEASAGEVAAG